MWGLDGFMAQKTKLFSKTVLYDILYEYNNRHHYLQNEWSMIFVALLFLEKIKIQQFFKISNRGYNVLWTPYVLFLL